MKVNQVGQVFTMQNGTIHFEFTKVLYSEGEDLYIGKYRERISPNDFDDIAITNLFDVAHISRESYCPTFLESYTRSPSDINAGLYVKRSNLMQHGGALNLSRLVLRDIQVCEALRLQPHTHIAQYHGCEVRDGRVTGICFSRYQTTLMEKINPKNLNKHEFLLQPLEERVVAAHKYLPGIARGVRHMHSLGLAHNDINPSNIMLDRDDNPVIIDFDSCLSFDEPLYQVKRTPGWYSHEVTVSLAQNDLDALAEMKTWLTSASPADFKFRE